MPSIKKILPVIFSFISYRFSFKKTISLTVFVLSLLFVSNLLSINEAFASRTQTPVLFSPETFDGLGYDFYIATFSDEVCGGNRSLPESCTTYEGGQLSVTTGINSNTLETEYLGSVVDRYYSADGINWFLQNFSSLWGQHEADYPRGNLVEALSAKITNDYGPEYSYNEFWSGTTASSQLFALDSNDPLEQAFFFGNFSSRNVVSNPSGDGYLIDVGNGLKIIIRHIIRVANFDSFSPNYGDILHVWGITFDVVNDPNDDDPIIIPTATLSLTPAIQTITIGSSATLNYSGTNIVSNSCSVTGYSGSVSGISGTITVTPTITTVYTITCTKTQEAGGGPITANASVEVSASCGTASYEDGWNFYTNTAAIPSGDLCSVGTANPTPAEYIDGTSNMTNFWWQCKNGATSIKTCYALKTPISKLTPATQTITSGDSTNLTLTTQNVGSCTSPQSDLNPTSNNTPLSKIASYSVSPLSTTNYQVSCTSGYGWGPNPIDTPTTANVTVLAEPTAVITSDAPSVVAGASTVLHWKGTNADRGYIALDGGQTDIGDPGGDVNTRTINGTRTVTPTQTTTYTFNVYQDSDPFHTATDSVTVYVTQPSVTASCGIASYEDGWNFYDSVIDINNSTDDGDLCAVGNVNPSPAEYVDGNSEATNFWWQCKNSDTDIKTCYALKTPTAKLTPATQTIISGDSAPLTLTTQNVGSCSSPQSDLNSQISDVNTPLFNVDVSSVSPLSTTDYQVSCTSIYDWGGPNPVDTPTTANVTVNTLPATLDLKAKGSGDADFTDNPEPINLGGSMTLQWTGTNILPDSCSITNVGPVANPTSNTIVKPSITTVYTILCTKTGSAGGGPISDSVTVYINPQIKVDLKVNGLDFMNEPLEYEELARITWDSQYADSCTGRGFETYGVTDGSVDDNPQTSLSYSVTCVNSKNQIAYDYVFVPVKIPDVAPSCGAADGGNVLNEPTGTNACSPGSSISGMTSSSNAYNWSCIASGYSPISCSATKLTGDGGDSDYYCTDSTVGGFYETAPTNLCDNNSIDNGVYTKIIDGMEYWSWNCSLADAVGDSEESNCQAYKRPVCGSGINTCALGVKETVSNPEDVNIFKWSCFYDYPDPVVFDSEHSSSPCTYTCPDGEIIQNHVCKNVGTVDITKFEPEEKIIEKGGSCVVDWEVDLSTMPAGNSATCELSGFDTATPSSYSSAGIYTGSNTTSDVQSRAEYTLTCYIDGLADQIIGQTMDIAHTVCNINPDIDEF